MTRSAIRLLWMLAGFVSLGLGIVGILLPLVPTTIFMIIAAFCFSRSSKRLHDWLMNHKYLGKTLRDWNAHGIIPLKAKIMASGMMSVTFIASLIFHAPRAAIWGQAIVLPLVALFIWSRPSKPISLPNES